MCNVGARSLLIYFYVYVLDERVRVRGEGVLRCRLTGAYTYIKWLDLQGVRVMEVTWARVSCVIIDIDICMDELASFFGKFCFVAIEELIGIPGRKLTM